MKIPLLFFEVNSKIKINDTVIIPDPPRPVMALPMRKVCRTVACEVTMPPMPKRIEAKKTQSRGEKIDASLADNGDVLDIAI